MLSRTPHPPTQIAFGLWLPLLALLLLPMSITLGNSGPAMNQPAASDGSNSSADSPANSQELVKRTDLYPELLAYLNQRAAEFEQIPDERKADLARLADYIRQRQAGDDGARITFICTHNSRRSHLAQVWAQVAAYYYAAPAVTSYSGGTAVTALNPRTAAALQRAGLRVETDEPTAPNPRYRVAASDRLAALECYSKKLDEAPNPTRGFAAVLNCAEADQACPLVSGCDLRLPIRYDDPKAADGTAEEAAVYDQRSRQICREMLYVMWLLKQA